MSKNSITRLAIATAAIALLGFGCAKTKVLTQNPATIKPVDACDVFTPDIVKAVFGKEIGQGKHGLYDYVHAQENTSFSSCAYVDANSTNTVSGVAIYAAPDAVSAGTYYQDLFKQSSLGTETTIPNLGDEAFSVSISKGKYSFLHVLQGNREYMFSASIYGQNGTSSPALEENIAHHILDSVK